MARPIYAKTCGVSLGKLVEELKVGRKDNTILMRTKGRRLADFTAEERAAMEVYNRDDTDHCRAIFRKLLPHYTPSELWQIDALTRMRTEPKFELDFGLLETAASVERSNKHKAKLDLAKMLGFSWGDDATEDDVVEFIREQLASAQKFSALLESLGVPVPMKPSPTNPENVVPALAKTDEAFIALQAHPNPVVAAAAMARLGEKSTLFETRVAKFITAGRMAGGRLPVPLRYCGADTTGRDSGEEYNCQNLPRITPGNPKPTDALRRSMRAPAGHVVGVADQSGIELRVNHFLWKVPSSMALYEASPDKADLYRAFASENLYDAPPDEITKPQRQVGKIAQLGLGFGAGAVTFQRVAKIMGGIDLPLESEDPDEMSATRVVDVWRAAYPEIVKGWKRAGACLTYIATGVEAEVDPWGLVHTCREGFVLPSGRLIRYPDLRDEDDGQWADGRPKRSGFYGHGRHKARITGPKAVENIVQALARDSIFDCALEFFKRTGLRPSLRVHDELVYVFPKLQGPALLDELQGVMRTPPKWWPQLVVWSEGDLADTYGDAK